MQQDPDRSAPRIDEECPHAVDEDAAERVMPLLNERFAHHLEGEERFSMTLRKGPGAGYISAHVGKPRRPHIFEFFTRDVPGTFDEGALPLLIDFMTGSLQSYFAEDKDAYFPLDFTGHPFGEYIVFARSEVRDLDAEAMAEAWLKAHDEV